MKTILTGRSLRRAQRDAQQLLPGIPDEISLDLIVPKLPWTAFQTLSSVSPKWRHAIRSGQVYRARVRSRSTETLVVVNFGRKGFALHSTGTKSWLALPPTPNFDETGSCNHVFLDGKLYVFGKLLYKRPTKGCTHVEVYVLDLAGHKRQWIRWGIRRERMSEIAGRFADPDYNYCSTGGQLHVLRPAFAPGGYDPTSNTWSLTKDMSPVAGFTSEVYDPKLHSWSPRKPYPFVRRLNNVVTLGDELLVYSNYCSAGETFAAHSLDVYNPAKDEWRVVGHWRPHEMEVLFTAHGKIYAMSKTSVWVHDSEKQSGESWTHLHQCSYPGLGRAEDSVVLPARARAINCIDAIDCVRAIDAELIAKVRWEHSVQGSKEGLLRSRGFKSEKEEIVWEKMELRGRFRDMMTLEDMILPIQL